jgi:hypothetical protein
VPDLYPLPGVVPALLRNPARDFSKNPGDFYDD